MPIRPRHLLSFLLILPWCGVSALAQQPSTGLQQRMSQAEFHAAGLDKLSPQELQNLDAWLRGHAKVVTKMVDKNGKPEFYAGKAKREKIYSRVKGHFDGWSGSNEYALDNGQVWKQIGSDTVQCMTADNPSAKVKPSVMGNWLMYVSGCNDSVHVERIR
ncbi:MAG TPA: hypothetical protein VFE77_15645 [Rhodanobacter sp.]|nr:hypothetical protein [Rhodanobacter sp.]